MAKTTRITKNKSVTKAKAVPTASLVKDIKPRDVDAAYYGPEPNFNGIQGPVSLVTAFNWYSRFCDGKDAKEFMVAYAEKICKSDILALVKKAPESQVNKSIGWVARLSVRGMTLDEKQKTTLNNQIEKMVDYSRIEEKAALSHPIDDPRSTAPRKNVQEVMRERATEAASEIDSLFDEYHKNGYPKDFDTKIKVMAVLKERNILPQHISNLIMVWEKVRVEYIELQTGKCKQLIEAYSFMSKTQVRNVIKFIDSIISDLNGYVSIKQVAKKPRARKPVPVEKIVAKLKHCKVFKDEALKMDLVGIQPSKLHNSTEAWVYDTKKRKMHHYVADEYSKCLIVKGNSLVGFDKKESVMKTLRKPSEQIKALTGSKPVARKYFKEIKAVEAVPNGRFNDDMIILRCF